METKLEFEYPSSPHYDDSDGEGQDSEDDKNAEPVKSDSNVASLLKRLQSSGALIKKPKEEYHCRTCVEDFPNWEELENHLIQHVSLPSVVVDKLPSDDEDIPSDDNFSEDEALSPPNPAQQITPQKMDISQILKKTGLSIKKQSEPAGSDSALNKLSGLGFTIKKNSTPVKEEPESDGNDIMQRLGKLGGIKLKLKSDGGNTNSFKVINGLRDFKASDEEDECSGNEEDIDDEHDRSGELDGSPAENDSCDEITNRKNSESDDSDRSSLVNKNITLKKVQPIMIAPKTEPITSPAKPGIIGKEVLDTRQPVRPAMKQTPKRISVADRAALGQELHTPTTPVQQKEFSLPSPDRRQSQDVNMESTVVKKEVDSAEHASNFPLFSGQIKSERSSPGPPTESSTPMVATVKPEPDPPPASFQPIFSNQTETPAVPLLPVAKTEDTGVTIIEINGDSNDEDDDCCVVSATPAPDVKPVVPKVENPPSAYPPPVYPAPPPPYTGTPVLSSRLSSAPSTEKQHNFNWNAPDSKPPIDMLEKSADDIFESLLSSTKKENHCMADASEYISLDTLGPQHSCEICNTRFTSLSLLEEHKRMTGHSNSLVAPSSSTLLPYSPSSNILSSLLPVKQLADQVGKLSGIGGGGPGFTHQQNVMINIQAYPGGGMVPQSYNSYGQAQGMSQGYPSSSANMYAAPGQQMPGQQIPGQQMHGQAMPGQSMPGQYPSQSYMGQQPYSSQYQPPMSKAGYPSSMANNSYSSSPQSPYSSVSPLHSMQQTVYGHTATSTGMISAPVGQMGPPLGPPGYAPSSSPGSMKPPTSNVRIQNVQTFPPGQSLTIAGQNIGPGGQEMPAPGPVAPGQIVGGQMPSPGQIRMAAGANISGSRPRLPGVRSQRPSIRPGVQVHGQVRGIKPGMRMPMKRPAGAAGGPGLKRRPDMLLPGKHDNEDCQVMAMQKQREGLPMIQSVQGAKDKLNLGSQISITKKTVNKEANAMANVLASRGISVKQKQKSRSPSPERPLPMCIPNLGSGVSIKHTSKASNFSIPEAKVGTGMQACKICKKMFMSNNSLAVHMTNAHPQCKVPIFKCDECPASYPRSLQLQHHKREFHNVSGPNRELGLPVVDLSQEENLKRLSSLGIYSFIPLANREQASGCFGIPVISVHNAQNGLTNSLQALGADGMLSLGPLKPLPN